MLKSDICNAAVFGMGDSQTGITCEYFWSEAKSKWIVCDYATGKLIQADRLVIYTSEGNGDETGLNHGCIAADFDATPGRWLFVHEADDEIELADGVSIEWDSNGEK